MQKNILSNSERMELIERYQQDKLNPPPANIKDETLIKNYGTDEQKARLQAAPAAEAQKAAEEQTTNEGDKSGTEPAKPDLTLDLTGGDNHGPKENQAPTSNQDYINAFTEYLDLHVSAPDPSLTTEQLQAANKKRSEDLALEAAQAREIQNNMKAQKTQSFGEMVSLVNVKTGDKQQVSRYTFENFMGQMPEWKIEQEPPAEIKPPAESIGK